MSSRKKPKKTSTKAKKTTKKNKKTTKKVSKKKSTIKAKAEIQRAATTQKIAQQMINTGIVLIFVSVVIFVLIFAPVLKEEIKYLGGSSKDITKDDIVFKSDYDLAAELSDEFFEPKLVPADENFSIIVPKINANSKIIENVDPYNAAEYQVKLTEGVAHAKGTSLPGEPGNTFLFAHSSDNFYNANRYNSVFYLLSKMETGDAFFIVRDRVLYEYEVNEKSVVNPDNIEYLTGTSSDQQATLMTCWPPGTTSQRLVLVGNLVSISKK